jgi:hypothetical protein
MCGIEGLKRLGGEVVVSTPPITPIELTGEDKEEG